MENTLRCDHNTLVVGHSSGAVAAMRYAETHCLAGVFLVGAYTSSLGCAVEQATGYFDGDWRWQEMKRNVPAAGKGKPVVGGVGFDDAGGRCEGAETEAKNDIATGDGQLDTQTAVEPSLTPPTAVASAGWYQYASDTDPFLPVEEQAEVARQLSATIRWDKHGGHYNDCDTLPALLKDITGYLNTL